MLHPVTNWKSGTVSINVKKKWINKLFINHQFDSFQRCTDSADDVTNSNDDKMKKDGICQCLSDWLVRSIKNLFSENRIFLINDTSPRNSNIQYIVSYIIRIMI